MAMDAEQRRAVARLKRMKVCKVIQTDPGRGEPSFDDWWFQVAFETDIISDEFEFDFGEYNRFVGTEGAMDMRSYKSAKRWMAETIDLLSEENRPRNERQKRMMLI